MAIPPLDLTDERVLIGDTVEFVNKQNTMQAKLEAYSSDLNTLADDVEAARVAALAAVASVDLPVIAPGDAKKLLQVKADESGHELVDIISGALIAAASLSSSAFSFNYAGKNLLINGDQSIAQRGDYSAGTAATLNTFYVDRWMNASSADINLSHNAINNTTHTKSTRYDVTTTDLTTTKNIRCRQYIKDITRLRGRTVTLTAQIKTNTKAGLVLYGGVSLRKQTAVQDGSWHTISATYTVDAAATFMLIDISTVNDAETSAAVDVTVGDYIEVSNVQLELGSEFTGFEDTPSDIQLIRCQHYYQKYSMETAGGQRPNLHGYAYTPAGTANVLAVLFPVTMRAVPTATITGTWNIVNSSATKPTLLSVSSVGMELSIIASASTTSAFYPDSIDDVVELDAEIYS